MGTLADAGLSTSTPPDCVSGTTMLWPVDEVTVMLADLVAARPFAVTVN